MGNELVSIIIPAYNVEQYIEHGIISCLEQTYKNIELVIVDDGSTDGPWQVIEKYAGKDSRINAIRQKNQGVSSARNQGLQMAKGDFVIFLDSDNWAENDAVEYLMELIGERRDIIASCECFLVSMTGEKKPNERFKPEPEIIFAKPEQVRMGLATGEYCATCAGYKLYPRQVINGIYFDTNIYNVEDGLFVFQAVGHSNGMIYSSEPKWDSLLRPGSAMRSGYYKKLLTAINACEKMLEENTNPVVRPALVRHLVQHAFGLLNRALDSSNAEAEEIRYLKEKINTYITPDFWKSVKIETRINYILILYLPIKAGICYRHLIGIFRREKINRKLGITVEKNIFKA